MRVNSRETLSLPAVSYVMTDELTYQDFEVFDFRCNVAKLLTNLYLGLQLKLEGVDKLALVTDSGEYYYHYYDGCDNGAFAIKIATINSIPKDKTYGQYVYTYNPQNCRIAYALLENSKVLIDPKDIISSRNISLILENLKNSPDSRLKIQTGENFSQGLQKKNYTGYIGALRYMDPTGNKVGILNNVVPGFRKMSGSFSLFPFNGSFEDSYFTIEKLGNNYVGCISDKNSTCKNFYGLEPELGYSFGRNPSLYPYYYNLENLYDFFHELKVDVNLREFEDLKEKVRSLENVVRSLQSSAARMPGPPGQKGEPGFDGAPGIAGIPGQKGEQGFGEKGQKGAPGLSGFPGSPGLEGAPGFPGLKGDAGPKGDKGLVGLRGEKGEPGIGVPGQPGLDGKPGAKGETGVQGPVGSKGDKGETGAPGIDGQPGVKGAIGGPGVQGIQGQKGDIGPEGPKGNRGWKGAPGLDGLLGVKGEPGMPGLKGAQGERGAPGIDGLKGISGEKGEAAPKGDQGEIGTPGTPGEKGAQGEKGEIGMPGPKGDRGLQGLEGIPGPKVSQGPKGEDGVGATMANQFLSEINKTKIEIQNAKEVAKAARNASESFAKEAKGAKEEVTRLHDKVVNLTQKLKLLAKRLTILLIRHFDQKKMFKYFIVK